MFWSRPRHPAASGVQLRLASLLEDRCVPCSGHEVMTAAVTPADLVALPVVPAVALQTAGMTGATGPALSVAPSVAEVATPSPQPVAEAQTLIVDSTPGEADPMLIPG